MSWFVTVKNKQQMLSAIRYLNELGISMAPVIGSTETEDGICSTYKIVDERMHENTLYLLKEFGVIENFKQSEVLEIMEAAASG